MPLSRAPGFDWLITRIASPGALADCLPAVLSDTRQQLSVVLQGRCRVFLYSDNQLYGGQPPLQNEPPLKLNAQTSGPAAHKTLHWQARDDGSRQCSAAIYSDDGQLLAQWCVRISDCSLHRGHIELYLQQWHQALEHALQLRQRWQQQLRDELEQARLSHAAELHDTVAQTLSYLRMQSARLLRKCRNNADDNVCPVLEQIDAQSQLACRQTREIINGSRAISAAGDLNSDIATAVAEFESLSSLVFEQDLRCDTAALGAEERRHCLMMLREALSNAVRHARASHVRIHSCTTANGLMQLHIEDNGVGLAATRRRPDSFGLQILEERARRIGAAVCISDRPGGGTRITITLGAGAHD
ncbi:histidine kinase [Granulosicoccaceae sp. 1_MG-2023]|nr:histidine kinase [Granulosicoccaceae sp. 1_MG-2023]